MSNTTPENTSEKHTVAILFADLVHSTSLYETKGDTEARTLVAYYLETLIQITRNNSGHIVKTLGDGVMAYFSHTDHAIQTAIDIHQKTIAKHDHVMESHIGIHFGEVIFRNNDIFGDAVNLASRLSDIARVKQTILSEQTYLSAGEFFQSQLRNIDQAIVKGKAQAINIYELINMDDDQTIMYTEHTLNNMNTDHSLQLSFKEHHFSLSQTQPDLSIGRDQSCDIIIDSPQISRHHAQIKYHKGKFIFSDQSTNGSYIQNIDREIFLHREQTILPSRGTLSLGVKKEKNRDENLIRFSSDSSLP